MTIQIIVYSIKHPFIILNKIKRQIKTKIVVVDRALVINISLSEANLYEKTK
jgi:hypothetical protein